MDSSHHRLTLNLGGRSEIFYYSWGEHPKIGAAAKFGGEVLWSTEGIALRSFKFCVYLCCAREKLPFLPQFQLKSGNFFLAWCRCIQSLQASRGYVFRILRHFVNKFGGQMDVTKCST